MNKAAKNILLSRLIRESRIRQLFLPYVENWTENEYDVRERLDDVIYLWKEYAHLRIHYFNYSQLLTHWFFEKELEKGLEAGLIDNIEGIKDMYYSGEEELIDLAFVIMEQLRKRRINEILARPLIY